MQRKQASKNEGKWKEVKFMHGYKKNSDGLTIARAYRSPSALSEAVDELSNEPNLHL